MASKTPTKYLLGCGISILIEQVYNNSEKVLSYQNLMLKKSIQYVLLWMQGNKL